MLSEGSHVEPSTHGVTMFTRLIILLTISQLSSAQQLSLKAVTAFDGSPFCAASNSSYSIPVDEILGIPFGVPDAVRCGFQCTALSTTSPGCVGFNYRNEKPAEAECQFFLTPPNNCIHTKNCIYYEMPNTGADSSVTCSAAVGLTVTLDESTPSSQTTSTYPQTSLQNSDSSLCPVGWNGPYSGNCYYVSPNGMIANQSNARSACLGLGAELTSVVNDDEFSYITNISLALTHVDYWIGLLKTSSASTDRTTYFLDLSVTPYRPPWLNGDPNGLTTCTRLRWDAAVMPSVGLADLNCATQYHYLCKMAIGYNRTVVSNVGFGIPPVVSINSWIVIQNKLSPGNSSISFSDRHAISSECGVRSISFSTQKWNDYRDGFGDLMTTVTNYWIGNKHINSLTASAQYKLRVEVRHSNGLWYYAEYGSFIIGEEADYFPLSVTSFTGDADDALQFPPSTIINVAANGKRFSTSDRNNALVGLTNCAQTQGGGWWYGIECSMPTVNVDGMAYWYDGRSTQATAPSIMSSMMKIQLAT